MLSEFLFYLLGLVAAVGHSPPRADRCPGLTLRLAPEYARVDGAFDFDRLRRKHYGAGCPARCAAVHRSTLPVLQEVTREPRQLRDAGEQLIPVASIVGSVDGTSQLFDQAFRPVDQSPAWAAYWSPCAKVSHFRPSRCGHGARRVLRFLDGHHRVAAAPG